MNGNSGNDTSSVVTAGYAFSEAAVSLKIDLTKMKESGFAPMVHGFLISVLVVVGTDLVR